MLVCIYFFIIDHPLFGTWTTKSWSNMLRTNTHLKNSNSAIVESNKKTNVLYSRNNTNIRPRNQKKKGKNVKRKKRVKVNNTSVNDFN